MSEEKVKVIICFLQTKDAGGGKVGQEARQEGQAVVSFLASSLPRFIAYCYVAACLGLLMSVCVCVSMCPVCSDVGQTREDGEDQTDQSKLHIMLERDSGPHHFFQSPM